MLGWLLGNLKEIGLLSFAFFSLFTLSSNNRLKKKNNDLQNQVIDNNKLVDIQQRVIDVTENTKPSDFDGNIKRMQDGEL
jgi:hypothetical protein